LRWHKDEKLSNCFLYAFFGIFILLDSTLFSYNLIYDSAAFNSYCGKSIFGIHNDFTRIAETTDFTVRSLALLNIMNSIIAIIAAVWLGLEAGNKLRAEDLAAK